MDLEFAFVDTCVMSDIIKQYNPKNPYNLLSEGKFLKRDMLRVVNRIVSDQEEDKGYIIASTFTFVELLNKMNDIFAGNIKLERIMSIMQQPPSWLIIEDINNDTAVHYCDIPNSIDGENVSSDDAVLIASALQRGDNLKFLTTDHIISKMNLPGITIVNS